MDTVAIRTNNNSCTVNEAMNILFSKLDEAIEDMEEGRVQTIDEAWKEIDIIQMIKQTYQVVVAQSGKQDIKDMKKYIIETLKYRELGENFSKKIKKAAKSLDTFPVGYESTGFIYRGYEIYVKPSDTYLLFYTVDHERRVVTVLRVMKDGMNWKFILKQWLTNSRQR